MKILVKVEGRWFAFDDVEKAFAFVKRELFYLSLDRHVMAFFEPI